MYSHDDADASLNGHSAPMPPVTSQHAGITRGGVGGEHMAAPFTGAPTVTARNEPTAAAYREPEPMPWEEESEEGVVEPAFEEDVQATEDALAALSRVSSRGDEEFPLDAFIIPEHTRSLPTGLAADTVTTEPTHTPVTELADKLEKLSHRLRVEDADTVIARLAAGDKLDTMLAGLLAGFVAGSK